MNEANQEEGNQYNQQLKIKAKKLVLKTLFSQSIVFSMTFVSRIINLIFTVLISLSVSKVSFGISTVYLSFIYSIIISFPKNVIRKVNSQYCHDESEDKELKKYQESIQLSHLTNLFLCFLSIILYFLFPLMNSTLKEYKIHIFIFLLSGIIEIYSEIIIVYMNVKLINTYKSFLEISTSFMNLFLKYIFAVVFKLDLWTFTLSRLFTSIIYACSLIILSSYKFNINIELIKPNFRQMKLIFIQFFIKSDKTPLKKNFKAYTKSWFIGILVSFIEKTVLSFFVIYSDEIKAEYAFIKENFSFFISNSLSPTEENFFILLNKLKNYKGLTTLRLSKDINANNYSGDFSFNENTPIIKSESAKKTSDFKQGTYSYQLLKTAIRLNIIFGILILSIFYILGNKFLTLIFSKKWSNLETYNLTKLFLINFSLLSINTKLSGYGSACYESDITLTSNQFKYCNNIFFAAMCILFAQYSISGIVCANIIYNIIKIFIGWYFTVENEFRYEQSRTIIYHEMFSFAKESFIKKNSLVCLIVTICICLFIKYVSFTNDVKILSGLFNISINITLISNCIVIGYFEKDDLIDILKLKIND